MNPLSFEARLKSFLSEIFEEKEEPLFDTDTEHCEDNNTRDSSVPSENEAL